MFQWGILFLLLVSWFNAQIVMIHGQISGSSDSGNDGEGCRLPPQAEIIDLEALRRQQYGGLSMEDFIRERTREAEFDEDGHPIFEDYSDEEVEEGAGESDELRDGSENHVDVSNRPDSERISEQAQDEL